MPFLGPILTTSHRNVTCLSTLHSGATYWLRIPTRVPANVGEIRFFIVVAMVLGSCACIEMLGDFAIFHAAGSQLGVKKKLFESRFWLSTSAVRRTRRLHTPHQERVSIWGLWLLVMSCSYPQVKCQRSVGGCFFCLILCLPNFNQFRLLQTLKVEVWTSVETRRTAYLKRITSCH